MTETTAPKRTGFGFKAPDRAAQSTPAASAPPAAPAPVAEAPASPAPAPTPAATPAAAPPALSPALLRQMRTGKLPTAGAGLAAGESLSAEAATPAAPPEAQPASAPAQQAEPPEPVVQAASPRTGSFGFRAIVSAAAATPQQQPDTVGPGAQASDSQADATPEAATSTSESGQAVSADLDEGAPAGGGDSQVPASESPASPGSAVDAVAADAGASEPVASPPAEVVISAAPATSTVGARGFGAVLHEVREREAAESRRHENKVSLNTAIFVTQLLEAVAHDPGLMADADARKAALRALAMQAREVGAAVARGCYAGDPPAWFEAKAMRAAASLLAAAWKSGRSIEEIQLFNEKLAGEIVSFAREVHSIAEHIDFDQYIVADSRESASARLCVSITSAIGRLVQSGIEPNRAGETVDNVMTALAGLPNHAGMGLDMRTSWMQGSLGRVVDLTLAVYESPNHVVEGDDRLADCAARALDLFRGVERNAKLVLENQSGERPVPQSQDDRPDDRAPVPVAG